MHILKCLGVSILMSATDFEMHQKDGWVGREVWGKINLVKC